MWRMGRRAINFSFKYCLFFTAIIVAATGLPKGARSAENLTNLINAGPRSLDQDNSHQKSADVTKQDNRNSSSLIDVPWQSFSADYNKGLRDNNAFNTFRGSSAANTSVGPTDQFKFGDSYVEFQTQRFFRIIPGRFDQTECTSDDDVCPDASGLPRSRSSKLASKQIRKPYIGLSISTPLQ
jgi:hypothetical protein